MFLLLSSIYARSALTSVSLKSNLPHTIFHSVIVIWWFLSYTAMGRFRVDEKDYLNLDYFSCDSNRHKKVIIGLAVHPCKQW